MFGEIPNERFWQIVSKSASPDSFLEQLSMLTDRRLLQFWTRLCVLENQLYRSDTWCAAYLLRGGCGDTSFDRFRTWVVFQGQEQYLAVDQNPDVLANSFGVEEQFTNDWVHPVISNEILKRGLDLDAPHRIEFEFDWEEDDDESMKKICPTIYEVVDW